MKEAQSLGKTGPKPGGKQAQTQTKRAPNGAKLYKHGPYIPRGPPDKNWARTALPAGAPTPLLPRFGPIFRGLPINDVPKTVV